MAEIKITQQMIDFYRSKPGNSVLLDSAIVDLIKKDIELGKLPKEFVQLANDVQNKGYTDNGSNVFGYGFNTGTNSELQIERTSSQEELEEINKNNYRKSFIENIIREEIGDDKYKANFNEYFETEMPNGITIKIDAPAGKPRKAIIETPDKMISVSCFDDCIKKSIMDKKTNACKEFYYDYSGDIYQIYDENNTCIYDKELALLASEIAKDLTNTNFLGLRRVRNSLPQNINKITSDNVLLVMQEYYKLTGQILSDDIFEYADQESSEHVFDKFREAVEPQKKIPDLASFLEYTGIRKDFDEMYKSGIKDYDSFMWEWNGYTGRYSFEDDFRNSNLNEKEKDRYVSMIQGKALDVLISGNFKPNLHIENAQINNDFYKSDNIYDIKYGKLYEPIIIKNKTTGTERVLDLRKLLNNMSTINRLEMWTKIQDFPPEALEDLAVECDKVVGNSGNEGKLEAMIAAGYYSSHDDDKIVTATLDVGVSIHELGHAIDWNYKNNNENINQTSNDDFMEIFNQEIDKYIAEGNKCFSDRKNDDNKIYCTSNEREMFAECYTLLMLGDCNSKDTILKYFPNCLKAAENLLKEIRKLPDDVRHQK